MVKPLPTECSGASEKLPRLRDRDKTLFDLQLAMHRLQKRQEKATIAAVAREANVTPALIHNRYPDFAEEVRKVNGKATREQRDAKQKWLGLFEQLFPKDKWIGSRMSVLGKAHES